LIHPVIAPSARQTNGGLDWGLTDKCGQCFEVLCVDGPTRGEEWSDLGRWGGCQARSTHSPVISPPNIMRAAFVLQRGNELNEGVA
jgi:hypothetical protein